MRLYDRSNEKLGRVVIIRPMQDAIEISQTLYPYGRSWKEITNFVLGEIQVQEFLDSGGWDSLFRETIRKRDEVMKSFFFGRTIGTGKIMSDKYDEIYDAIERKDWTEAKILILSGVKEDMAYYDYDDWPLIFQLIEAGQ